MDEMVEFVAKMEFNAISEESPDVKRRTVYESLSHPSDDPARKNRWKKERKSVYVSLKQHHLPRLEEEGVVEFDAENGQITPTPRASFFRQLLVPARADELEVDEESTSDVDVEESPSEVNFGEMSPQEPTADDRNWTRYYATLCVVSWSVAIADGLNLVGFEMITAGQWVVLFLLKLTALVCIQMYSQYRPAGQIPLVP